MSLELNAYNASTVPAEFSEEVLMITDNLLTINNVLTMWLMLLLTASNILLGI